MCLCDDEANELGFGGCLLRRSNIHPLQGPLQIVGPIDGAERMLRRELLTPIQTLEKRETPGYWCKREGSGVNTESFQPLIL